MKKFYSSFVVSAIWIIVAIANYYDRKNIFFIVLNILLSALFAILGGIEFFLAKKGELKKIYVLSFIIVILLILFVILVYLW